MNLFMNGNNWVNLGMNVNFWLNIIMNDRVWEIIKGVMVVI